MQDYGYRVMLGAVELGKPPSLELYASQTCQLEFTLETMREDAPLN